MTDFYLGLNFGKINWIQYINALNNTISILNDFQSAFKKSFFTSELLNLTNKLTRVTQMVSYFYMQIIHWVLAMSTHELLASFEPNFGINLA